MRAWSREPLLHFAVLAAAIFGVHAWTAPARVDGPKVIEVSAGDVEQLAEVWRRQWQRPPTEDELRAVVEQRVREEMLYRQALAHGLLLCGLRLRLRHQALGHRLASNKSRKTIPAATRQSFIDEATPIRGDLQTLQGTL